MNMQTFTWYLFSQIMIFHLCHWKPGVAKIRWSVFAHLVLMGRILEGGGAVLTSSLWCLLSLVFSPWWDHSLCSFSFLMVLGDCREWTWESQLKTWRVMCFYKQRSKLCKDTVSLHVRWLLAPKTCLLDENPLFCSGRLGGGGVKVSHR